jgi:hypothetical protein
MKLRTNATGRPIADLTGLLFTARHDERARVLRRHGSYAYAATIDGVAASYMYDFEPGGWRHAPSTLPLVVT